MRIFAGTELESRTCTFWCFVCTLVFLAPRPPEIIRAGTQGFSQKRNRLKLRWKPAVWGIVCFGDGLVDETPKKPDECVHEVVYTRCSAFLLVQSILLRQLLSRRTIPFDYIMSTPMHVYTISSVGRFILATFSQVYPR